MGTAGWILRNARLRFGHEFVCGLVGKKLVDLGRQLATVACLVLTMGSALRSGKIVRHKEVVL